MIQVVEAGDTYLKKGQGEVDVGSGRLGKQQP